MTFRIFKKSLWFWCIYLLTTTLLALLGVEGAVRLLGLAPTFKMTSGGHTTDPHIPYKRIPLSVQTGRVKDEYSYNHRHNSLGFRDIEHSVEKPPGVFRILGLGDSFTAGWGASFEETYLHRLEVALNSRPGAHPRVEILKHGINGYYPESENLVLKHYGLRFDPDLVIVGFVPNDLYDTHLGLDAIRVSKHGILTSRQAANLGQIGIGLYEISHAARLVLKKYSKSKGKESRANWWKDIYRHNGIFEESWAKIQLEYQEMALLAGKKGAGIVVLHIPNRTPRESYHAVPAERLGEWCDSQGIPFVDSLPALKEAAETEEVFWKRDHHCTPAGYRVVAETLFDYLVTHKLVP